MNEVNLFYLLGSSTLDNDSRYEEQNDKDEMPVYVKYNRMLHGRNSTRSKKDTLTIQFLKTYIHYAKNRIHPELTDEVIKCNFCSCIASLHFHAGLISLCLVNLNFEILLEN